MDSRNCKSEGPKGKMQKARHCDNPRRCDPVSMVRVKAAIGSLEKFIAAAANG